MDLCFKHHHYEVLEQIAEDLTEESSSDVTKRLADHFMEKGLFDKAMELLARAKRRKDALELCTLHSVPLTEELVEKISIPEKENGEERVDTHSLG